MSGRFDPEQFEREQRDLFDYGDIQGVADNSPHRYSTLAKQLNPHDPTPSIATEFLTFLEGCRDTRPELEEKVWSLVCRTRRAMFAKGKAEGGGLGDAMEACGNFVAVAAKSEDGLRTPGELEAARQSVLEKVEKVTVYAPSAHLRNAG